MGQRNLRGLRGAAAASALVFYMHNSGDMRRLAIFTLVAAVVPPPVGIVTGFVAIGFYEGGKALKRSFMRAQGGLQAEDLERLESVNAFYHQGRRKGLVVALPQKTVSPLFEIR